MNRWVLASRPKTLVAIVVPVWLGTVFAMHFAGTVDWMLGGLAFASALCIQIATNFFNDALDFSKGADTEKRVGPIRASASGAIVPQALIVAGITMLMMAVTFSWPLIFARGWPIVFIGIPSLYFSFGYTGGPVPLAYRGLGELFVIIFFGLVAVTGMVYIHAGEWWWPLSGLLGMQAGLYATALIAINNLRDREEDSQSGKRTLAVRYGKRFARVEIAVLCLAPLALGAFWWTAADWRNGFLFPLLVLPVSQIILIGVAKREPGVVYNAFLGMAALQMLLFAILFTLAAR